MDDKIKSIVVGESEVHFGVYNTVDDDFVLEEVNMFNERIDSMQRLTAENTKLREESEALQNSAVTTKGTLYFNGQPVQGYFETTKAGTVICGLKEIEDLLTLRKRVSELEKRVPSMEAIIQSVQKKSDKQVEDLTEEEATKRYGEKIIADYKRRNKSELMDELMPDFYRLREDKIVKAHRQEVIDEYRSKHPEEFLTEERIQQIKAEAIAEYKATAKSAPNLSDPKVNYSLRLTAEFIARLMKGESLVEIINSNPVGRTGKPLERRSVYRLTTVSTQEDYERVLTAYELHKNEFGDVTLEQLTEWLNNRLAGSQKKADEKKMRKLLKNFLANGSVEELENLMKSGVESGNAVEVDDWGEPIEKEG